MAAQCVFLNEIRSLMMSAQGLKKQGQEFVLQRMKQRQPARLIDHKVDEYAQSRKDQQADDGMRPVARTGPTGEQALHGQQLEPCAAR